MCIRYTLLLVILIFANLSIYSQISGKIILLPDNKTYQVSIIPSINFSPPLSTTNNAQITLVAPVGGLNVSNFQSITGQWDVASIVEAPTENPNFSYYSISLGGPVEDIIYNNNTEIILFTFQNSGDCIGAIAIIDNRTDPFIPPNSQNINVGNLFSILGVGPTNAYNGVAESSASCPSDLDVMISLKESMLPCANDVTDIFVEINGGDSPFTIKWTNTQTQVVDSLIVNETNTTVTIANVPPGSYDIEVFDARNAGTTVSRTISAPNPIIMDMVATNTNCAESMDGVVEITAISGGTGSYTYEWNNGVFNSTLINRLGEGTYEVTVTDDNGCTLVQSETIKIDGWIDMRTESTDISCFGEGDGAIKIEASGKNPPFTYEWSGNGQSGNDFNLNNLQAGIYDLKVIDATGICNRTHTVEIREPAEITVEAIVDGLSICELETEGTLVVNNVQNARGAMRFSLDGINFVPENEFLVNAGDAYTITVQDEAGCYGDKEIQVPAPSGLELGLPSDLTLRLGDDLQIAADYFATTNVSFEWSPAAGLSCTDCPNPTATPTQTTTYTLTVSDDNGCIKEASVIVYLSTTRRVYTPNAFSPNGDGRNDRFTIYTSTDAASVLTLQIFDRWGNRVYISPANFQPNDEFTHGWNGRFNGQEAPPGVYAFFTEILFIDGETEVFKGDVNLIR